MAITDMYFNLKSFTSMLSPRGLLPAPYFDLPIVENSIDGERQPRYGPHLA